MYVRFGQKPTAEAIFLFRGEWGFFKSKASEMRVLSIYVARYGFGAGEFFRGETGDMRAEPLRMSKLYT